MDFDQDNIRFNRQDQWAAELPSRLPLRAGGVAFRMTMKARELTHDYLVNLLTCDVELMSDAKMSELYMQIDRLNHLDYMAPKLAGFVVPRMLAQAQRHADRASLAV